MHLSKQLAKNFRDVHSGGNWTVSDLKGNLTGITWKEAITRVHGLNTIATLVFHTGYFVNALLDVLNGKPLDAKDELSFAHPPIHSQKDWEEFLDGIWSNAEKAAALIEQVPESKLWEDFSDPKYGNYYRNIQGITEHLHYHLGQIALIKKIIRESDNSQR